MNCMTDKYASHIISLFMIKLQNVNFNAINHIFKSQYFWVCLWHFYTFLKLNRRGHYGWALWHKNICCPQKKGWVQVNDDSIFAFWVSYPFKYLDKQYLAMHWISAFSKDVFSLIPWQPNISISYSYSINKIS